jgi:toxin FitB
MIILDTNVVSAMMRADENPVVMKWLNMQNSDELHLTSSTVYEILYGLAIAPKSKRIEELSINFELKLITLFKNRILPLDLRAAELTAKLAARRKLSGINIDVIDTQIAGIALANNGTLATRNIKHFEDAGIKLVNPWQCE